MITPYWVGTPRGNAHRPLGRGPEVPERTVGEWLVLGKALLKPGQFLLKIARQRYYGSIYTWIGLYAFAAESDTARGEGSYAGAGLLAQDAVLPGEDAIRVIHEIQTALLQNAVKDHKFIKNLSEVHGFDRWPQVERMQTSRLQPDLGLRPVGERGAERNLFIYPGKPAPAPSEAAARCLDWAQSQSFFAAYDELYFSVEGIEEPPLGTEMVSFSWVAEQVARQQARDAKQAAEAAARIRDAETSAPAPPPAPSPPSPAGLRRSEPSPEPAMSAQLPPAAVQALVDIADDLRLIRHLLQGKDVSRLTKGGNGAAPGSGTSEAERAIKLWPILVGAGVIFLLLMAAGLLWLSRLSPAEPVLPTAATAPSDSSAGDTAERPEEGPVEAARDYYQAISEGRISDAARMRGLSRSAESNLERNRAAFASFRAEGFELTERNADRAVVEARIVAIRRDGTTDEGSATVTFVRDASDGWTLSRVREQPAELALLPGLSL